MVGTCENASLGPDGKLVSCPANIFRITITNSSAPGHKRGDRVGDTLQHPPLKKKHPHRTAKSPVVRACSSKGTGTWESRPHVWQAHLPHSQEKLYPPGYWLFWALCSGFLQELCARSQKFFHAKVSSKAKSLHEKFWWKNCFLGKFLASSNLHVKSWPWIYSSVQHTCWLEPRKTVLSSGSSSSSPLGHVKSCILWVLYNLLVKNAALFLFFFLLSIKLLLFLRTKAPRPRVSVTFPFVFT